MKQQKTAINNPFGQSAKQFRDENKKIANMSPEQFQKKYYSPYSPGVRSAEETSKNNKTKFDLDFYNKLKSTGETTQPFEEFRKTWGLDPTLLERNKKQAESDYYQNKLAQIQGNIINKSGQYGDYSSQVSQNRADFLSPQERYNLIKAAGEYVPSTFEEFSAEEANRQKSILDFNNKIKAQAKLNPNDIWEVGGGRYTRKDASGNLISSGDYMGNGFSRFTSVGVG